MKKIFIDIKTLIAELVGLFGGFFWGKSTSWDYEPLILLIVSIFSLLITLYYQFIKKEVDSIEKTSKLTSNIIGREIEISTLDAIVIMNEIRNAPPFLENELQSNYKGFKIKWLVSFIAIRAKSKSKNIHSVTAFYKDSYIIVNFDINIDNYPIFKIAKKNELFVTTGKILNVTDLGFDIDIEKIEEPS